MPLIELAKKGLYCALADVYIDPWQAVPNALITHAHSDHARGGNGLYMAHEHSVPILAARLGKINAQGYAYGKTFSCNGVKISFHPAGHVPGSALEVFNEINAWWAGNAADGVVSVMMAYSLGKAQRILQHLDQQIGPVIVHPVIEEMNEIIRGFSPSLPQTLPFKNNIPPAQLRNAMLIVSAASSGEWLEKFKPYSMAFASGWTNLRGKSKWGSADRGFTLSDHADWNGLNKAVKATGAQKVYVTHGYTSAYVRWLREQGIDADELKTLYEGDSVELKMPHS
ncbi:MAG: DNA ligase-associated DEXH box helicase [Bacteroidetes bacterium]|nr:DNA ligase-associated DEXH box helicase [Bacteroidota bacterium]